MTELLFPEIDEAAVAAAPPPAVSPRTEIATAAAPLDLAKLDLTEVALSSFGPWRGAVAQARSTLTGLVLDLSTQTKVDEAKSLRFRLVGQPRADVRKVSKALKSKLASVSKAIGAEEEAAVKAWDDAEALISPQIDARQAELDAERIERERIAAEAAAAAAAAESARIVRHNLALDTLKAYPTKAAGASAEKIAQGIAYLQAKTIGDDWQEFAPAAEAAKQEAIAALKALHAKALQAEADAAERSRLQALAEAQAAELAKLRAAAEERERAERQDREAKEAADKAEAERVAAEEAAATAIAEAQRKAALDAEIAASLATMPKTPADDCAGQAPQAATPGTDPTGTTPDPVHPAAEAPPPAPEAVERPMTAEEATDFGALGAPESVEGPEVDLPEVAHIRLGAINNELGIDLTSSFIRDKLGITGTRVQAAWLYTDTQRRDILVGLILRIERLLA